jgi:hypothetical protein
MGGENKMTKRNSLLVSLFLVFGIMAMAASALAQTTWTASTSPLSSGRPEGKAEATGPVTIAINTGGSVPANSYFTITYSAYIPTGAVDVTCGGKASPPSPWASGFCTNLNAPTISGSGKVLTIQFGELTTFTTGDGSHLNVTVRVDATGVTPLPGQVTAAVTATAGPGGKISVGPTTPQEVLAVNAKPSLVLEYDPYKDTLVDKGTPATVLTCIGAKDIASYDNQFVINIFESFPYALTTEAQEMAWAPGEGLNESFASVVTNGSNIIVTFSHVPATLAIKAVDIEPCSKLNPLDPLYCGTSGTLGLTLTSPSTVASPTAGKSSFTYTVSSLDVGSAENVSLTFSFTSNGPLPPGLSPMTVNVAYAPTLTSPLSIPYFTGKAESVTPLTVVNFYDCVTYMLFPYINTFMAGGRAAFANFGTGIDFANTTMDPFGLNFTTAKGSAVPQTGSCTVFFYPANLSVGTQVFTTASIPSGGSWAFDVASSVPKFAGNTGYAIAICNFQNAYGFAEIYDNYGIGAPTCSQNYNAYILPDPEFYHRNPAGHGLGENAIAPVNMMELLQKLLAVP